MAIPELLEHSCYPDYSESYNIKNVQCNTEIGHGGIEKRKYYLCSNIDWFSGKNGKILMRLEC